MLAPQPKCSTTNSIGCGSSRRVRIWVYIYIVGNISFFPFFPTLIPPSRAYHSSIVRSTLADSGDLIVLIFPDGTGPDLLSCLITGIPPWHMHALNFAHGECWMGVRRISRRSGFLSQLYTDAIDKRQGELMELQKKRNN